MNNFATFKEISIGGLTKSQLMNQLIETGVQFNHYANTLFEHPTFAPAYKAEKVQLVKVSLSDLQMTNPCSFQEIIQKASKLELKACPLYLGAFLRLQYLDQPEGPHLTIVSLKLETDEEYPNGFYIRNFESRLWLRGYRADDHCEWPAGNEFIFQK